jgi:ComF family protein
MPVNLAYQAYKILWTGLDWLYPPNCGGCGRLGVRWCDECAQQTREIPSPICPICGNPNTNEEICPRCREYKPDYAALGSWAVFGGAIRNAIHQLKYRRGIGLGKALACPMVLSLMKLNWSLDIITSIPLGLARLAERGYNQATLLARPIALYLKVPFSPYVLARIRETRSQVGLSLTARQENMAGAFLAKSELVRGKSVLVIDDVATSGATFLACANALLEAGASTVYGYTLARAVYSTTGDVDMI